MAGIVESLEVLFANFRRNFAELDMRKGDSYVGGLKKSTEHEARKLSRKIVHDRKQTVSDITTGFSCVNEEKYSFRTIQQQVHSMGYRRRVVRKSTVVREGTENFKKRPPNQKKKKKEKNVVGADCIGYE